MEVGIIGLGNMGTGIARSLLGAGHQVAAYNRTPAKAAALASSGATVADSIADACRSGVVITMLADDAALGSAALANDGILASLPRGGLHISCSTISVALSDKLTESHARAGQSFVSAPVFGRPEAAEGAKLAVVAAGEKAALDRCKPLFEALGPKLLVIGEKPSQANVVKLTGNFMIATVLESLSEAIAFARKSGVDPAALLDFLTSTLFNAPVYKTYGGLILEGKFEPAGFVVSLGLKDIRLVLQAAEAKSVPLPIASVIRDRFLTAIGRGHQNSDWSVIAQIAAEDAGLSITKSADA
ncbi:MAG TPA: NAD(P)-dependent oxidoreductase [Candidatus Eisenbacteria bacterium]|nr:NAD(P)-dependent oxidoreductase [Candidatus Eisenbacteria bacterium]